MRDKIVNALLTIGLSLLLVSALLWDNGNIEIIQREKLEEYILKLKIPTEESDSLEYHLDLIYRSGKIAEFLTNYYYYFVIMLTLGLTLVCFSLSQYIDYFLIKKRVKPPSVSRSIRLSLYVMILCLFFFYSRLRGLDSSSLIFLVLFLLMLEFVINFRVNNNTISSKEHS